MFTDTDSLVYEIRTEDVYKDFYEDKSLIDFSDYPQDSEFFDPVNKIVLDEMKDVFEKHNWWICWIKGKNAFLNYCRWWRNEKAKGVNKKIIKSIRHKEHIDVLSNKKWWDIKWIEFKVNDIKLEIIM